MKKDLTRLLTLIFLSGITYMVYVMLADVQYLTKLMHSYIAIVMEYAKQ